jgi:hypothetical protein
VLTVILVIELVLTLVRHRICLQTDGHGETSIPPYNFVVGDIMMHELCQTHAASLKHNNVMFTFIVPELGALYFIQCHRKILVMYDGIW